MFIWVEQELYCLPSHEAVGLQGGDRRRFVWVRRRLDTMKAAETLVYKRQSSRFCIEEENVVVAADFAVERGQAFGGEVGDGVVVKRGLAPIPMSACLSIYG